MRSLTFGSLFAGIGGFDLGLENAGMECFWQVENDGACQGILERHWFGVKRYGDVEEIEIDELKAVDLICGGWPCQDLSVAGKRGGLDAERSGLFFEAVRVIRGLKPKWVLLENVPGLFSQNEGMDFADVDKTLTECGYGISWRVLDSQYFGVPQRRRRVFIVGCFGEPCPPEILFESQSGKGDIEEGEEEGEGDARGIVSSLRSGGKGGIPSPRGAGDWIVPAKTVTTREGQRLDPTEETYIVHENMGGSLTPADRARALRSGASHSYQFVAFQQNTRDEVRLMGGEGKIAGALAAQPGMKQQNFLAFNWQSGGDVRHSFGKPNLCASQTPAVWQATTPDSVQVQDDNNNTPTPTKWMGTGGHNVPFVGVRRLTPTECERLQGFPDGWTSGQSDSVRYRQLGNAVTVPVIEWIGKRIVAWHQAT